MKKLKYKVAYLGIKISDGTYNYHVTLEYLGQATNEHILSVLKSAPIGKTVEVKTIVFGMFSNTHIGMKVKLPECVRHFFVHNIPHFTIWCSETAKPVDTWKAFNEHGVSFAFSAVLHGCVGWFDHKGGFHSRWSE